MVTLFGRGPTSYLAADRPQKSNLLHYKSYIESEASAVDIFSRRLRLRDLVSTRHSTWESWCPLSPTRFRTVPRGWRIFVAIPLFIEAQSTSDICNLHVAKKTMSRPFTNEIRVRINDPSPNMKDQISTNLQPGMGYYIVITSCMFPNDRVTHGYYKIVMMIPLPFTLDSQKHSNY